MADGGSIRPISTPPSTLALPIGQGLQVPKYNPQQATTTDSYTVNNNILTDAELTQIFSTNPEAAKTQINQEVEGKLAKGATATYSVKDPTLNNGQYFNLPATFDSEKQELTVTFPDQTTETVKLTEADREQANPKMRQALEARGIKLANFQVTELNSGDTPLVLDSLKQLDAKAITVGTVKDDGNSLSLPQTRFGFIDENRNTTLHLERVSGAAAVPVTFQMAEGFDEKISAKGTDGNDVFYSRYTGSSVEADLGRGDDLYSVKGTLARITDAGGRNFAEVNEGKSGSFIKFGSDADKKTTAAKSFAHIMGGTTAYYDQAKTRVGDANTVYISNTDKKQEIELKGDYTNVITGLDVPIYDANDFNMDDQKVVRLSQVTSKVSDEHGNDQFVLKDELFAAKTGFFSDSVEKVDRRPADTAYYNPTAVDNSPSFFSSPGFAIALVALIGGISTALTAENGYVSGYGGGYSGGNDYGGFA